MASFIGEETYSIDNKGRVNIPAKMRKDISPEANETFVVTQGFDNCIIAYPHNVWKEKYEKGLEELDPFDKKSRMFRRKFLRWAEEVKLDGSQRISLPRKLLEIFGIKGKVTIVGQIDYIEFWNPDTYDEFLDDSEQSYEEIAAEVMARK